MKMEVREVKMKRKSLKGRYLTVILLIFLSEILFKKIQIRTGTTLRICTKLNVYWKKQLFYQCGCQISLRVRNIAESSLNRLYGFHPRFCIK